MVTGEQIRQGGSNSNKGDGLNTPFNTSYTAQVVSKLLNAVRHKANAEEGHDEANPAVTVASRRNDCEEDAPWDSEEVVECFPASHFVYNSKVINGWPKDDGVLELLAPGRASDLLVVLENLLLSLQSVVL